MLEHNIDTQMTIYGIVNKTNGITSDDFYKQLKEVYPDKKFSELRAMLALSLQHGDVYVGRDSKLHT